MTLCVLYQCLQVLIFYFFLSIVLTEIILLIFIYINYNFYIILHVKMNVVLKI